MDQQQLTEYRYRAVREVLGGSPIGEVAARYGMSRQTLHTWRRRFDQGASWGWLTGPSGLGTVRRGSPPMLRR
ncbi:transposase [Streptomyces sp. NPDC053474]|uniref:transposase n=1 Tax=Streptomyces sp. NPDC053474 TaxID=3365704 RepID=UPI0037D86FE2